MDEPQANGIEGISPRSDGDGALTILFGVTDLVQEVPYHRDRRCGILLHDPMA